MTKVSEGKYEGTPNQKINIQVLVYGEFSKYTQDYDLVDSVDKKGKENKVKQYKGILMIPHLDLFEVFECC